MRRSEVRGVTTGGRGSGKRRRETGGPALFQKEHRTAGVVVVRGRTREIRTVPLPSMSNLLNASLHAVMSSCDSVIFAGRYETHRGLIRKEGSNVPFVHRFSRSRYASYRIFYRQIGSACVVLPLASLCTGTSIGKDGPLSLHP